MTPRTISVLTILLLLWAGGASAAPPQGQDLKLPSIEQLMEIDVTLGTRQPEPLRTLPQRSVLLKGDAFHSRDALPDRPAAEFTEPA